MPDDTELSAEQHLEQRLARLEASVQSLLDHARHVDGIVKRSGPLIGKLSRAVHQLQAAPQPPSKEELAEEAKRQAQTYAKAILHAEAKRLAELSGEQKAFGAKLSLISSQLSYMTAKYNRLVAEVNTDADKPSVSLLRLHYMDGKVVTLKREVVIDQEPTQ
jgi:hypothetical protein